MKTNQLKSLHYQLNRILLTVAFALSLAVAASAAPGDLDPTWGNGGIVVTPIANLGGQEIAQDLLVQPDGKVIVSGYSRDSSSAIAASFIARYNPNGTLDMTFGTKGKIIIPVAGGELYDESALQSDGKIVVGGSRVANGNRDYALARYNADGTLDSTFGTNGKVFTPVGSSADGISDLILQPGGKIIAAGFSYISGSDSDFSIARYNADGTLDTTFGTEGKAIVALTNAIDFVASLGLQPDGKILIGGTSGGSNTDFALVRLLQNGTLDISFGTDGKVITALSGNNDSIYDLALQSDGKIVAAGAMNYAGGSNSDTAIVRYNPNGSIDTTFAVNGVLSVSWSSSHYYVGNSVAIQPNGKIIGFGFAPMNPLSGTVGFATARYNTDGSPDTSFGNEGRVITRINTNNFSYGFVVEMQPDGKIIAAGSADNRGTAIVRYLGDSAPRSARFDFDGDGKSDVSVFRPSNGVWYLLGSSSGTSTAAPFGLSSDRLAPADFDGDGRTDIAVFRDGVWYWLASSDGNFNAARFGQTGDVPVPFDYTGDGRAELAVYRAGVWFTFNLTNNQFSAVQFGLPTDKAVPADYDGDGKTDTAVYRDGVWYLLRSRDGFAAIQFGNASDKPVAADYDGDGKADAAVFRAGVWYLQRSSAGLTAVEFGSATDTPVPADYDGDGKTDIAVFRAGVWYLLRSQQGFGAVEFGAATDQPIPAAFVPQD